MGSKRKERMAFIGGELRPTERRPRVDAGKPQYVGIAADPRTAPDDGNLGEPVDALPGSAEKIDAMRARAEAGQNIFHPDDHVEPYCGGDGRSEVYRMRGLFTRKVVRHDQ